MAPAAFRTKLTLVGLLASSSLCIAASPRATGEPSLYERMGGAPTVAAVVDELIDRTSGDPKLKRSFDGVSLDHVKKMLTEQLCSLTGGGCTYSGDSMKDVHAGHGIDQAEFYGMVEILRDTLRRHGVALRERNELLAILAPMKRDVVER